LAEFAPLYIAASLDGFIARPDGDLDWLLQFPPPAGTEYGYQYFTNFVNTIIMGNGTYQEIIAMKADWSLATFKRDFQKISSLSPQKWLIEKRLKIAKDKLSNENKKGTEVYLEVGFKKLSHFSTAFKR
jgi:AraC-type DNA-binding domain-containing proteins